MDTKIVIDGKEYHYNDMNDGQKQVVQELTAAHQRVGEAQRNLNKETLYREFLSDQLVKSLKKDEDETDTDQ